MQLRQATLTSYSLLIPVVARSIRLSLFTTPYKPSRSISVRFAGSKVFSAANILYCIGRERYAEEGSLFQIHPIRFNNVSVTLEDQDGERQRWAEYETSQSRLYDDCYGDSDWRRNYTDKPQHYMRRGEAMKLGIVNQVDQLTYSPVVFTNYENMQVIGDW